MPSPFPGMNPYLEEPGTWSDFHTSLYGTIKERLNATLPPGYAARLDRYVWIHEPEADERTLLGEPDVFVIESETSAAASPRSSRRSSCAGSGAKRRSCPR